MGPAPPDVNTAPLLPQYRGQSGYRELLYGLPRNYDRRHIYVKNCGATCGICTNGALDPQGRLVITPLVRPQSERRPKHPSPAPTPTPSDMPNARSRRPIVSCPRTARPQRVGPGPYARRIPRVPRCLRLQPKRLRDQLRYATPLHLCRNPERAEHGVPKHRANQRIGCRQHSHRCWNNSSAVIDHELQCRLRGHGARAQRVRNCDVRDDARENRHLIDNHGTERAAARRFPIH